MLKLTMREGFLNKWNSGSNSDQEILPWIPYIILQDSQIHFKNPIFPLFIF